MQSGSYFTKWPEWKIRECQIKHFSWRLTMGVDVSHDAFSGSYSSFDRFRRAVAKAMGGSYPPHDDATLAPSIWYWGEGYNQQTHPGLSVFFSHSDCDGFISPELCDKLACEMAELLPGIDALGEGDGHIKRGGGYGSVARKFIAGCRLASTQSESLEFY